jgi:RNA polymerase sigma-70 factor (ECF subfamily)
MQDVQVSRDAKTDWEAVYRAEAPNLWRSLVLQTGSPDIASDAVAEAFAQGIARGDAVRTPGAWVWKAGFMIARAEAGRIRADLPAAQAHDAAALEPVLDLLDGLRTLSSMQRSATVLHYFAGYSLAETAAIIGSTRSAVGVHLFRARRKLRDELEDRDEH